MCELLRANLYEFQKYNRDSGDEVYFTLPRIQSIARQVLRSLAFLHSLGLIHSDLKPENILIRSYSRCAAAATATDNHDAAMPMPVMMLLRELQLAFVLTPLCIDLSWHDCSVCWCWFCRCK